MIEVKRTLEAKRTTQSLLHHNPAGRLPRYIDPLLQSVREAILQSGLSIKQIAQASGIGPHTIARWLDRNVSYSRTTTISAVVKAIKCRLIVVPDQHH